jgi:hypothetical protein
MKKSTFKRCFVMSLLASVVLLWVSLSIRGDAATGQTVDSPAADPGLAKVAALRATGPHPSVADQGRVFGRFVVTWDGEYTEFPKDGKPTRSLRVNGSSDGSWTAAPYKTCVSSTRRSCARRDTSARLCVVSIPSLEPGARLLLTRRVVQSRHLPAAQWEKIGSFFSAKNVNCTTSVYRNQRPSPIVLVASETVEWEEGQRGHILNDNELRCFYQLQ